MIAVAETIAKRSTCNRLAVGAVVARDGRIQTTGYNGSPAGMHHCEHVEEWEEITLGNTGKVVDRIRTDPPCSEAVHAEANAISFAARYGMATEGCEMYVTHAPCLPCAKLIVNSGIVRVVYHTEFRDMSGIHLLRDAGLTIGVG